MGYRSNVLFVIRGTEEHVKVFLTQMRLTLPDVPGDPCWEHIKTSFTRPEASIISMRGTDWKWYPDYDSVKFFESFWSAAEEYSGDELLDGAFVRIGENDEDIETRYFGNDPYELANVSRNIESGYELE